MMIGPPQRTALDGGAGEDGEEELAEARGAIALVRKIAVMDARNGKHADEIKRDRGPDGHRAPADPDYTETRAVEDDEGDAAHPIHLVLLRPKFFATFRNVVGIEPLNESGDRAAPARDRGRDGHENLSSNETAETTVCK